MVQRLPLVVAEQAQARPQEAVARLQRKLLAVLHLLELSAQQAD